MDLGNSVSSIAVFKGSLILLFVSIVVIVVLSGRLCFEVFKLTSYFGELF